MTERAGVPDSDRPDGRGRRALEADEPRATRAQLRAVIENIDEGLVIVDAAGAILTINETARQMIGYGDDDRRRLHISDFPEFLEIFALDGRQLLPEERPIARVMAGESFADYELRCRQRRTGREWVGSFVGTPVRDPSGRVELAVLSARDITERKRAEQVLWDAARQKDAFLAMLGHELRNPLAPILTAAELLQRSSADGERVRSFAAVIERQVRHLARIVDDLLDVSRISSGRILLRRELLDLRRLVEETASDHRAALEARGLRLELRLPPAAVWVDGDPTRLAQVLDNLLVNSEKFTDPGGAVAIEVWAEDRDARAVVAVRDTGIGMEPELLATLFEPFSQGDTALARSSGGLGLGMALVKGLVELHGGEVEAASGGSGLGSEFTFRLPLAASPPVDTSRRTSSSRPSAGGRRVLVIEDNGDVAETLQSALAALGHRARIAANGWRGIELVQEWHPDVVLCDIGLTGELDGYGVARALRAEHDRASARAVPLLVAVSGYGREEDRRRAAEAGFARHLTKPVTLAMLDELLAVDPGALSASASGMDEQTPHERRVVEEREERFGSEPSDPAGPAASPYAGDTTDDEDYEEEIEAERTGDSADR